MGETSPLRGATPADIPGIARVHVQAWRETYAGIVPAAHLAQLSTERSEQVWVRSLAAPAGRTFVLAPGGQVQGFVSAGPTRGDLKAFDGEIYALYLLGHLQGRGHGRRLFAAAVEALRDDTHRSMALWVLRDNPTRGFYAHMGGVVVGEQPLTIGGEELVEVAYGWPRLSDVTIG